MKLYPEFIAIRVLPLLTGLVLLALIPCNVHAEQAPSVKAHLISEKTVEVVIKSKVRKKKSGKIVVSRAAGSSNRFQPFLSFPYKGSSTVRFRETVISGVTQVRYRSRLTGKAASVWSRAVKVKISNTSNEEPEESSPESPAPQPTPEAPSNQTPTVNLPAGASACPRSEVLKVLELVNTARSSNGLASLSEHPALALSSQVFSAKMATTQNLSHDGWYDNILKSGYTGLTAGQNIGYSSQLSGTQMMNMWMNSSGHKANILSSAFSHIGIGCVKDKTNLVWWTQDFGG